MIKWLICTLWGHKFRERIITDYDDDGIYHYKLH